MTNMQIMVALLMPWVHFQDVFLGTLRP